MHICKKNTPYALMRKIQVNAMLPIQGKNMENIKNVIFCMKIFNFQYFFLRNLSLCCNCIPYLNCSHKNVYDIKRTMLCGLTLPAPSMFYRHLAPRGVDLPTFHCSSYNFFVIHFSTITTRRIIVWVLGVF